MLFSLTRRNVTWTISALAVMLTLPALPTQAQKFSRTDLVTNATDSDLINAWGMSRSSGSPWWVSDNGTGKTTLYDGTGAKQGLIVTIPPPNGQGTSAPTGQVFNYTTSFQLASGKPALFLFATEDGTIAGWNPGVNPNAVIKVNRSGRAIYKGIALAQSRTGPRLYATNFKTGRVDVFDSNFRPVRTEGEGLAEASFRLRNLGDDWAPFGIQNVGGNLVVTFAHRPPGSLDEDHGPGLGWVAVFNPGGRLLQVLQHGPWMNAPWGIALAPSDFGAFSHRLLIGMFGDGTIEAFSVASGRWETAMLDANGALLSIDGLWGLGFGNNAKAGSAIELYFTAGPNDENDGLFGKLVPVSTDQRGNTE